MTNVGELCGSGRKYEVSLLSEQGREVARGIELAVHYILHSV
jgi:hypothetical protein